MTHTFDHDNRLLGAYPQLNDLLAQQYLGAQLKLDTQLRKSRSSGHLQTSVRGRGLVFAEVRQYQPGDDIRSIDWRVTAKTQKTHTRIFTQERERPVIFAADLRSAMFFGSQHCFKSVVSAQALSLLAWAAHSATDKVGAVLLGDQAHLELKPQGSKRSLLRFLSALVEFGEQLSTPVVQDAEQHLETLMARVLRVSKPGSSVYIVSDYHDVNTSFERYLTQLAKHCRVTLIHVSDPLEWRLPQGPALWLSDGKQRGLMRPSDQPHQWMRQRRDALAQICAPLNIEIINLSTADSVSRILSARFAQGQGLFNQRGQTEGLSQDHKEAIHL